MKTTSLTSVQLISESYTLYHSSVLHYINCKVENYEEAQDLAQDVFLRLIDYKDLIRLDTIKSFLFTIARNLTYDYLRHRYKTQEITCYLYERTVTYTDDTESQLFANELLAFEQKRLGKLPPQRRRVYEMSRFGHQSIIDISSALNLSQRTVKNHLFISRKEVRNYLSKCM